MLNNPKTSAILASVRALSDGLARSSEKELYQALELEGATKRRKTVMLRIIQRIAQLKQDEVRANLINKYL